jgi:hypothetical protein
MDMPLQWRGLPLRKGLTTCAVQTDTAGDFWERRKFHYRAIPPVRWQHTYELGVRRHPERIHPRRKKL